MDISTMLPLIMGMMGNKNGGGDNMANIMSMLGNMNNSGSGSGGPDYANLMNMMKNFSGNNKSEKRRCEECERRDKERERDREREYMRQNREEKEAERTEKEKSADEPVKKRLRHSFYEENGIKNFDPIYFDEQKKQFGSRPIRRIAGEDINDKIDDYFGK